MASAFTTLNAHHSKMEHSRIFFDNTNNSIEGIDQVFKYQNDFGKWKFRWVKITNSSKQVFDSDFIYDQIIEVKNNCLYFLKNNQRGFWFFNTQTEFSIISI